MAEGEDAVTIRYFLRATQTEPTTGGDVHDLSTEQGTDPPLATPGNENAWLTVVRWRIHLDGTNLGGQVPTSLNITAVRGNTEYRWRVNRLDANADVAASSDWSAIFSGTGVQTATLDAPSTNPYGFLEIEFQVQRAGGMPDDNQVQVAVSDEDSYIDAEMAEGGEPASVGAAGSTGTTTTVAMRSQARVADADSTATRTSGTLTVTDLASFAVSDATVTSTAVVPASQTLIAVADATNSSGTADVASGDITRATVSDATATTTAGALHAGTAMAIEDSTATSTAAPLTVDEVARLTMPDATGTSSTALLRSTAALFEADSTITASRATFVSPASSAGVNPPAEAVLHLVALVTSLPDTATTTSLPDTATLTAVPDTATVTHLPDPEILTTVT